MNDHDCNPTQHKQVVSIIYNYYHLSRENERGQKSEGLVENECAYLNYVGAVYQVNRGELQ